jgi:hypothetical protein
MILLNRSNNQYQNYGVLLYASHPVICWFAEFSNFDVRILRNICYCLFLAHQNSLKLRKRVLLVNVFFCLSNKKFSLSVKRKGKQTFVLQNSKIRQISKSLDEIHTTYESEFSQILFPFVQLQTIWLVRKLRIVCSSQWAR